MKFCAVRNPNERWLMDLILLDLYTEVREDCCGRGFGSFLLLELKKECYLAGRVPAARCDLRKQNRGPR